MSEYVESVDIDVEAGPLFEFLSDVANLPKYMPRLSQAESVGDGAVEIVATPRMPDGTTVEVRGTAWTRVDTPGRTFSWGAVGGRHAYRGSFDIDRRGEGSTLTVRLNSERADARGVRAGLHDVLASIKEITERDLG